MARVKSPLFSAEASGKLGGIEYRTLGSGAVVGRRSIAPQRVTAARSARGAYLKAGWASWKTLSAESRWSWRQMVLHPSDAPRYYAQLYATLKTGGSTLNQECTAAVPFGGLTSPVAGSWTPASLRFTLAWTATADSRFFSMVRVWPTHRRRSDPQLRKFAYSRYFNFSATGGYCYVPFLSPYLWIDLRIIQKHRGNTVYRKTWEVTPGWTAGPGALMVFDPPGDEILLPPFDLDPEMVTTDDFAL